MEKTNLELIDLDTYNIDLLISNSEKLGLNIKKRQICQFIRYYELLIEWNSFMNLTAITDYNEVILKHFIDSISLIKAFDCNKKIKVLDIGTGAGFPGIPLKIVFPELQITLLDSLNKRINFLNAVIDEIELENVETIHGRAEDFAKDIEYREKYDLVVSRAVANLTTLSELSIPFVKVGGSFISYKSEKLKEEMKEADQAIKMLGGKINKQVDFNLPGTDMYRNFIIINKYNLTPKKYPRKAGLPAKEPLYKR